MAQTPRTDVLARQVAFHLGLPAVLAGRSEFGCIATGIRALSSRLEHREVRPRLEERISKREIRRGDCYVTPGAFGLSIAHSELARSSIAFAYIKRKNKTSSRLRRTSFAQTVTFAFGFLYRRQPHQEVSRCETPDAFHLINLDEQKKRSRPYNRPVGLAQTELGNALAAAAAILEQRLEQKNQKPALGSPLFPLGKGSPSSRTP